MDSSTGAARFGVAQSSLRNTTRPSALTVRGAVACLALALVTTAQAALIDRGGGLIYDDVLDVTWLQDANYAKTSGYDADGRMSWTAANTWAANLVYGGFHDWRLPTVGSVGPAFNYTFSNNATTDYGYAKTTTDGSDGGWRDASGAPVSELGHMFYVNLANRGLCTPNDTRLETCFEQSGFGLVDDPANPHDESLFVDLQSYMYWSGTAYASNPASDAWFFDAYYGVQNLDFQIFDRYAWAVRDGDVAAAPVPEPSTSLLILSGLAGLWGSARRRFRRSTSGVLTSATYTTFNTANGANKRTRHMNRLFGFFLSCLATVGSAQASMLTLYFTGQMEGDSTFYDGSTHTTYDISGIGFSGSLQFDPDATVIGGDGVSYVLNRTSSSSVSMVLNLPMGMTVNSGGMQSSDFLAELYRNYANPSGSNLVLFDVSNHDESWSRQFEFEWEAKDHLGTASSLFPDPNGGLSYAQPIDLTDYPFTSPLTNISNPMQGGFLQVLEMDENRAYKYKYHGGISFLTVGSSPVPEPATLLLTALGLAGLGWRRSKRT